MKTPAEGRRLADATPPKSEQEATGEVKLDATLAEDFEEPEAIETSDFGLIAEKEQEEPEVFEEQTKRPDISSMTSWGPSFGTAPHTSFRQIASSPLSSWFLSKGYVNFSKRPEYPKTSLKAESNTPAQSANTSTKLSHSDEFYKNLARSNWRMWYGHVNPDDILDPPLSNETVSQTSEIQVQGIEDEKEDTDQASSSSRLQKLLRGLETEKKKFKAFDSALLKILKH